MKNYYFILGASDPEMQAIETILQEKRIPYGYASISGIRVHPGNAYKSDRVIPMDPNNTDVSQDGHPYYKHIKVRVECSFEKIGWVITNSQSISIDHHFPGDPGYSLPPSKYWEASSIGQVCNLLNIQANSFYKMVAAADHCLGHAYAGKCPGVDPQHLMEWRVQSRAEFQGKAPHETMEAVLAAMQVLKGASMIDLGSGVQLADLRGQFVPELPEAGARMGMAYLAEVKDRDGSVKNVVGSADEATCQAFIDWANSNPNLERVYGDPVRGFAGAYQKK